MRIVLVIFHGLRNITIAAAVAAILSTTIIERECPGVALLVALGEGLNNRLISPQRSCSETQHSQAVCYFVESRKAAALG